MKVRNDIQWGRIAAEGAAIVASILLAFAIDAWWDDLGDRAIRVARMQSLVDEFREMHTQLDQQLESHSSSLQGTFQILAWMAPSPPKVTRSELSDAILASFRIDVFYGQHATLRDMLASGELHESRFGDLYKLLYGWPTVVEDLELDTRHLERNRDEELVGSFARQSIPLSAVLDTTQVGHPLSKFPFDTSVLLSDPSLETVWTARALRTQRMIRRLLRAREIAEEIIRLIEADIDIESGY